MTTASETPSESAELDALAALAAREHAAGRFTEAAEAYRQILALRPDNAQACNNLGNVFVDQGKFDEAAAQYFQALTLKPGLFEVHVNLGEMFRDQGKLDAAAAQYQQALVLKPGLAPAYFELGEIRRRQGQLDQAAVQFEQAIALRPDFAAASNSLGVVLHAQGKLDQAAAQYERAVALNPGLFQTHNSLGCLFQEQGKLDQALASFARALDANPQYPDAHNNLGKVFSEQGKFDEATAHYEQALALDPRDAEAHFNRADLKTFRSGDPELAALEALAADADGLPPSRMLFVHFALGKALEDTGDYERAFEHFLQGNALKRREVHYDEPGCRRTFEQTADLFDADLFDRFQGTGDPSPTPIFIVGMPRSGSTLVEQILASHPQVQAAGELMNLDRLIQEYTDAAGRPVPLSAWLPSADADSLRQLGEAYLTSLPPLVPGKTRITDKLPGNFLRVGLIRLILPNARIIHTVRDPVDTCISCFSRLFHALPYTHDLAELGAYYRWYHELMEHWRAVLPADAMLDVAYEDVVDNLEEQARRLIDYCRLPWDDRCLSFHKTSRPIATSSNVQVRRPLYRSSVARWRQYEAFLQPLLAELEGCQPAH